MIVQPASNASLSEYVQCASNNEATGLRAAPTILLINQDDFGLQALSEGDRSGLTFIEQAMQLRINVGHFLDNKPRGSSPSPLSQCQWGSRVQAFSNHFTGAMHLPK